MDDDSPLMNTQSTCYNNGSGDRISGPAPRPHLERGETCQVYPGNQRCQNSGLVPSASLLSPGPSSAHAEVAATVFSRGVGHVLPRGSESTAPQAPNAFGKPNAAARRPHGASNGAWRQAEGGGLSAARRFESIIASGQSGTDTSNPNTKSDGTPRTPSGRALPLSWRLRLGARGSGPRRALPRLPRSWVASGCGEVCAGCAGFPQPRLTMSSRLPAAARNGQRTSARLASLATVARVRRTGDFSWGADRSVLP